jgi:hypothetical protein
VIPQMFAILVAAEEGLPNDTATAMVEDGGYLLRTLLRVAGLARPRPLMAEECILAAEYLVT